MARLLIVEPEADFHTLFDAALAQAGYVAVEAANSYEGPPAADTARRAETRRPRARTVGTTSTSSIAAATPRTPWSGSCEGAPRSS